MKHHPDLHSRLAQDTHPLHRVGPIEVLLHRSAILPWFILVPLDRSNYREFYELSAETQERLLSLCHRLEHYLEDRFSVDKLNIAAIGNLVPQFHLHLVGRYIDDPCWPNPVWGNLQTEREWPEDEVKALRREIASTLDQFA